MPHASEPRRPKPRGLVQSLIDDVLVLVKAGPHDDVEFEAHLRSLPPLRARIRAVLVLNESHLATPGAAVRAKIRAAGLVGKPVAVVTPQNLTVRAAVAALNWLGMTVRGFPPEQLAEALSFLDVPVERRYAFYKRLSEMRAEAGFEDTRPG